MTWATPDRTVHDTARPLAPPRPWATAPVDRPAAISAPQPSADLLLSQPLLNMLTWDQAHQLAAHVSLRRCQRHAVVVEQGKATLALHLMLAGTAHAVRRGPQGRTMLVNVLAPGDSFGELGLIDGEAHAHTVRCVATSEVLVVPGDAFRACLAQSAPLRDELIRRLVDRLRKSNARIRMLALNDVRGCVVQHLLNAAEDDAGERVVRRPICRQTLADMLGASREMVSRVMTDLARSGAVDWRDDGALRLRPGLSD